MASVRPFQRAECFTIVSVYQETLGIEIMSAPGDFERIPALLMASGVSVLLLPEPLEDMSLLWQCSIRIFVGDLETAGDLFYQYKNGFLPEV